MTGPSASGKTTVLRAIAGFVRLPPGVLPSVKLDVTSTCRPMSAVCMVVQNYALFPHMRVEDVAVWPARPGNKCGPPSVPEEALAIVGMSAYARLAGARKRLVTGTQDSSR